MNPVARWLIIAGVLLVILGLLWQVGGRHLPLGRLPGDIAVEGERGRFYFPIVTCIILSIVLSVVLSLIQRFR